MKKTWSLKRTTQCDKCPWRLDVDPHEIPNGYTEENHCALASTIADHGDLHSLKQPLQAMACHESPTSKPAHCVGWLMNQLGPGNNIGLRLRMMTCANAAKIKLIGEQHERFEDTLP